MIWPSSIGAARRSGVALVELHHAQPRVEPGTSGAAGLGHGALVDREGVDLGAAVVIDEELGLEGSLQALQQRVVHRRTGKAELAHAADVGAGELGVRQQVVVQRGHQVEMRHLLVLDRRQRAALASKRGMQTKRPSISASASSERTPIV
jgi:hypothetical protein